MDENWWNVLTKACEFWSYFLESKRAKKVPSSGKSPCIPFYLTLCTAFRMRLNPIKNFWPCKKKNAENRLALLNQSPPLNLILFQEATLHWIGCIPDYSHTIISSIHKPKAITTAPTAPSLPKILGRACHTWVFPTQKMLENSPIPGSNTILGGGTTKIYNSYNTEIQDRHHEQ